MLIPLQGTEKGNLNTVGAGAALLPQVVQNLQAQPGKALPERKQITELQQRGLEQGQQKLEQQQTQLEQQKNQLAQQQQQLEKAKQEAAQAQAAAASPAATTEQQKQAADAEAGAGAAAGAGRSDAAAEGAAAAAGGRAAAAAAAGGAAVRPAAEGRHRGGRASRSFSRSSNSRQPSQPRGPDCAPGIRRSHRGRSFSSTTWVSRLTTSASSS